MKPGADRRISGWRRIALLASIGAVIAMSVYTTQYLNDSATLSLLTGTADKNRIDLFAEQVHGVKFDSEGKLVETLQAPRLDHYPERDESVLSEPALEANGKDGKVWKITAETATLVGDDEINLQQNVVIVDRAQTLRFESEQLTYFSKKQEAATDVAVRLQHLADVTTAIGMRANLNTNRIELLRNVDSHYAQPQ